MPDIIQMSEEPIDKDQWMTETDIENTAEYGGVISYVYDEPLSPQGFEEALREIFGGREDVCASLFEMGCDDMGRSQTIRFHKEYMDRYFDLTYLHFREKLALLLAECTKVAFVDGSLGRLLYALETTHAYRYGTYIYWDDELFTLDAFIRFIQPDKPYYIGSGLVYKT